MRIDAQDGLVKLSAPYQLSEQQVFQFVQSNLAWLQQKLSELNPTPPLQYLTGEQVPLLGKIHTLEVQSGAAHKRAWITDDNRIQLHTPDNASTDEKMKLLDTLYRTTLKQHMPAMLQQWQPIVGKSVNDWGIRKMKTRWGTCNITAKRVWLSLALAEKPLPCIEFVLVHELVHLHEKHHNQRFYDLMTQFMPDWEEREQLLLRC